MRLRVVLLVSLGINLALAVALVFAFAFPAPPKFSRIRGPRPQTPPPRGINLPPPSRQSFTWHEIESTDYRAYIANLKAIGCPESTIRDIIVADVNALYDRRRTAEIVVPERPWWRVRSDQTLSDAAEKQLAVIDAERRALLTELLGPKWEVPNANDQIDLIMHFDGPVLSKLSWQTKQAVQAIENHAVSKQQAYMAEQQKGGKTPQITELIRLRTETRAELAKLLNAQEMEEYLLRYSQTSESLRSELQSVDIKPEEFRALFRARDALEQNAALYFSGDDPASVKQRQLLEQQREDAVKQVLGPDRYALYRVAQDPMFTEARASIEQIGAPPEAVMPLFQINQVTEMERQRIQANTNLTLEERALALANMVKQQQESLRRILGDTAYERYQQQNSR